MLAAGANVVDEQVVMGDLVAVLGVVPKPAHVLDELAVVVDEGVVQRNHPLVAVARGRVPLQQFQPPLVQCLHTATSRWPHRNSVEIEVTKKLPGGQKRDSYQQDVQRQLDEWLPQLGLPELTPTAKLWDIADAVYRTAQQIGGAVAWVRIIEGTQAIPVELVQES